jgi:hypothetical protein
MNLARLLILASILVSAPLVLAADDSADNSDRTSSDAVTDDGNAGTIGERTLTPAEVERCKEAPPNDATCQGVQRDPTKQD